MGSFSFLKPHPFNGDRVFVGAGFYQHLGELARGFANGAWGLPVDHVDD